MQFLDIYVFMAFAIFVVGLTFKLSRWFKTLIFHNHPKGITKDFNGGPEHMSLIEAVKAVLIEPTSRFYRKANPSWNRGYMLYHIAIITKASGYALAAVILTYHMIVGNAIPNVATHAEESFNYSAGNLAAIVFGSGETLQANFLFGGSLGNAFMFITGVALIFAVVGNLHMVYTTLRNRGASAITGDIDPAATGVRANGTPKWDRVVVRLVIFTIIYTDIVARLHIVDNAVFLHAFLGATLLLLFPFTYLFHMVYNVLASLYSIRRRAVRTVA